MFHFAPFFAFLVLTLADEPLSSRTLDGRRSETLSCAAFNKSPLPRGYMTKALVETIGLAPPLPPCSHPVNIKTNL
ncbi:hypothetical protein BJY00DRAFT_295671 [Aspergillus carlsbadensis]|nr:hypothetical protein BJY00DRAFT_295671 [Aspergillus carlsbadensis]